jgi:hypothetical protein
MRMKSLIGLLAIGGAIAYAQKKRGGELSVAGFKKTLREIMNSLGKNKGKSEKEPKASSGMRGSEHTPSSSGRGEQHPAHSTYGGGDDNDFGGGANGMRKMDR